MSVSLLSWLKCQCDGELKETASISFTTADLTITTELKFLECRNKHRTSITDEVWHRLLTRSLDDPMIQWELKALGVKLTTNFTNRTFNSVYYKYTARK